jgi:hypothetical protein
MDKNTFLLIEAVLRLSSDKDKIRGLRYLKKAQKELNEEIERLEFLQDQDRRKELVQLIKTGRYTLTA